MIAKDFEEHPAAGRSKRPTAGTEPPAAMQLLQRAAGNANVAALLQRLPEEDQGSSPVRDLMRSAAGKPLEGSTRQFMEASLGADFSDVRIHTGTQATEAARSVQAHAYTVGSDIVFQDGQYDPGSTSGQKMLAHELTHVIQQRSGPVDGTPGPDGLSISDPADRFERAAEATADRVISGQGPPAPEPAGAAAVQRQEDQEEELQASAIQRQADDELEEEPA